MAPILCFMKFESLDIPQQHGWKLPDLQFSKLKGQIFFSQSTNLLLLLARYGSVRPVFFICDTLAYIKGKCSLISQSPLKNWVDINHRMYQTSIGLESKTLQAFCLPKTHTDDTGWPGFQKTPLNIRKCNQGIGLREKILPLGNQLLEWLGRGAYDKRM